MHSVTVISLRYVWMLLASDRSLNTHKRSLMHLRVYDAMANRVGIYLLSQKPKRPASTQEFPK
jgi:hypothetical protein